MARALDILEGPVDEARFEEVLLRPLHALVEAQLRCSRERKQFRASRPRERAQKPPPVDSAPNLRANWDRLVCVQGELNDWPANHPNRPEPEIVEWRACRLATGETFSATVRPRKPLGDYTAQNLEVQPDVLLDGLSWEAFVEGWRAFSRPDDVLAVWAHFHAAVAAKEGLPLPEARIDTRVAASRVLGRRPGTIERCSEALGLVVDWDEPGRCARRSAHLTAVIGGLVEGTPERGQP